MTIEYRVSTPLANETLNALFSVGWPAWQKAPDTSDWQPVLNRSLVYICAFEAERLIGFVNVAWDGRDHAFVLDTRVDPGFRMRGVGKELVARAAEAAKASGCEWLHVDYSPELSTFYEACGFKPTAAGLIHLGEHSPRTPTTSDSAMSVTLRPLALGDVDAVHSWARLPESCRFQAWGPNTYEQTQAFVQAAVTATADRFVFAVVLDGEAVGSAQLKLHGPSSAEIAFGVHPRLWGRGIATAAARELLRMGFADHGRHRIFGTCDPRNLASAAVLQKIGMRYEGRMRGTIYIRDGWRDSDLYARLADD